MFHSARLKLTAWYLLIIMMISILFSLVIYQSTTNELVRSLHVQQYRMFYRDHPDIPPIPPTDMDQFIIDPQLVQDETNRIALALIFINVAIFILAGGAGYFLAGRTLRPIQVMVDEQNRFITDASHELRTPLTALRSEIEVNLRDTHLSLDDAKQLLRSNLEEVGHLQLLSDNLLALAQFEKPNLQTQLASVALVPLIEEAVRKVTPFAKEKNIKIDIKQKPYKVNGDKQSLVQLYIILLDNAVKYSHPDTIIKITMEKTDHSCAMNITNHGIGIEKKDIPHLFERFYRADRSRTKQEVAGYGLGLSIAKKIVDVHNGSIHVKSEKNKSTTFTVVLPIATA